MSNFDPTGGKDRSGRSQAERKQLSLLSDLAKSLDTQHHNTSLMHEFGAAFEAPASVSTNSSGTGTVGSAPSPARSDHQHGAEVPTWIYPALLNSWVNYGAGYQPARYTKIGGIVHIQGLVKSGASTVFVLGVGYRPLGILLFTVSSGAGVGRIDVNPSGNVAQALGVNSDLSLSCSFIPD